jgi:Inorganic Pyrophosphatase
MPSELDPAYGNYLPPSRFDETPTDGMKRIEQAMAEPPERYNTQRGRLAAGAGRSLEGYNARVGAQGPVGGGVMVAADPVTGRPVMVGGQAQAGPLSYQYSKPTVRGAPASQQIGVGGQPFDADTYFGVSAQQAPGQGRTYGANVSQGGDDGSWSAYAGYNPTNRSANIGGSYQTNFATGGRAVVGHTMAAGEPVSLEEHKGEIRHRQDSGASRMAADYGYIDTSRPDHDGMKTDAFVGPHRDSKKVFVVNQQHPHTGKFNEHKVLLGYKDRAHALRDYAHSFSDGLGHKRIQSVVEMGTHELKDWLKKDHTKPLRKAGGGPVHMEDGGDLPPRPLTIYRGERPKVEAEPETDLYPSQEERPIPMPVRRPDQRPVLTPAMLAAQVVPPEQQSPIGGQQAASPSPEGFTEGLTAAAEGVAPLGRIVGEYASNRAQDPTQIPGDIATFGKTMYHAATEDPIGFVGGMLPGIGNMMAAGDVSKLKDAAAKAEAEGNFELADKLKALVTTAMAGVAMPMAGGTIAKSAARSGERALLEGVERGAVDVAERTALESADTTARMAEKFAGKAGTAPEEMANMFDDVRGTQVGKMVERYQDLPPEEAMQLLYQDLKGLAVEGEVGKEWYERSSKRILEFVGGDAEAADKFAQLIAIYSPQTAVDVNTQNAMKAYNRALAGEKLWDGQIINHDMTFNTVNGVDKYIKSLGGSKEGYTKIPLDDSGKRFLIAKHGNPNAYENIATLDRDLKAHLVMNEGVPFNGRKINNFYNNLMVQIDPSRLQGSTQDLWMARAFGYLDDAVGGGQKYEFMERLTADLAAELGWQPHQIQAAIWTAMKTRQEGVKDAVKATALELGIAERVPDPQSPKKMLFKVKEGREAEYGALMREQSLGADITPEAIAAAARDFSDFLDQNLAHISWESAPSTKVGHLDGFESLPPEAKAEYHMGIQQALQDENGQDLLARYLNILSPGAVDAPGYWEGASNPATLRQVGATRIKAAKQAPNIDSASKEMMEIYASALGLLLKQDGVGYHRPYFNPQITKANGMEFRFEKPLSSDDIVGLGKALDAKFGGSVAMIPSGGSEVRFLNFGDTKNQKDFHKDVAELVGSAKMDNSATARAFASDGKLVSNNWQERPNGEGYIRRIGSSGRSDVLEYISDFLAPRVEAFDKSFAAKHGLKRNEALERQIRNAKDITVDYAQGGSVRGYAEGGAVPLTHYSRRPDLTEVDPAYYGTNNPGEDVARTVGRPDGNPRRSYFYVGQPGDVMPEHNLGEHAYTTSSDKLYDLSEDPLKVYRGPSPRDLNRMEQVIRANGYEGILGQDAAHPTAVLFEKKEVEPHPTTRTEAAYAASDRLAKQATDDFQDFHMRKGGDVRKSAFVLKNIKGANLDPHSAYNLAGYLAGGRVDAVRSAIMSHPGFARGMSKMFHKRSHGVK